MPNTPTPYVEVKPGDLITADLFNTVQEDVKQDIAQQIQTSIGGITNVKHADDAGTLSGLNADQLTNQILEKVKAMIPGRTGYKRVFKLLKPNVPSPLPHNLGAEPVVDVYQLDYFQVVCAHGETTADSTVEFVNFYLYNGDESQVRGTKPDGTIAMMTIEDNPPGLAPFRIPFSVLLAEFGVDISNEGMTLDELVGRFWAAMFGPQSGNDRFFPEQYCHSPWFEKCCGEQRSIKDLKSGGHWDNIFLKVIPRKTINYPAATPAAAPPYNPALVNLTVNGQPMPPPGPGVSPPPSTGPTQLEVAHLDYNNAAIALVADPVPQPNAPKVATNQLAVMIIMKA